VIRLVVNADDLGLSPEIDAGIFEAADLGILTSASLLVPGRSFESVRARLADSTLGVGVHLAAVGGLPPVADPSRLPRLCEDGKLPRSWTQLLRKLLFQPSVSQEVLVEFEAQLARARDAGIAVDHVDAHQHIHVWPSLVHGVIDLCRRFRIPALRFPSEQPTIAALRNPVRVATMLPLSALSAGARWRLNGLQAPRFWGLYDSGALDRHALRRIIRALPDGDHEIGCHPGKAVQGIPEDPEWRYRWDAERVALCDPEIRAEIDRRGIHLGRFRDFAA
jgi:predicted glycoside hydrolase/deacetylase ChbG (UPF0249 family)